MKASTYLAKTLKDQLSPEDLEYIDTFQHGSSNKLREMVTDAAIRIIESKKYPKQATNVSLGHEGIMQRIFIGIIVAVIGGIIVYAITQGF